MWCNDHDAPEVNVKTIRRKLEVLSRRLGPAALFSLLEWEWI